MKYRSVIILIILTCFNDIVAQPYVEISSFNFQTFSAPYREDASVENTTNIYALNLLLPKQLKNGNAILFRINGESIHSTTNSNLYASSTVSSVSAAFGFQWVSKNQQFKTTIFTVQKLASDFESPLRNKDWQYGLFLLENYQLNAKVQFKAGMYFNRETFGNFFVPLIGLDWKVSDKIYCYGVLPTNYKIEYAINNKLYTGINFKALTRSFQLSEEKNNDYIRFDEVVLKCFGEYYVAKNLVFTAEIGYSLGKNPRQYDSKTNVLSDLNYVNYSTKRYAIFAIGLSYRVRNN